jgi:hypothetical protein
MRIRERPQQNGINDAKNRSVCTDTERKHDDGDEREPWLLQQLAERELQIFEHCAR